MSNTTPPNLPWHALPPSPSGATCKVHLLQAGSLDIPKYLALLPGPNEPNGSVDPDESKAAESQKEMIHIPDFVFLIEHTPTKNHYMFDLGMRTDLENLSPLIRKHVLGTMGCYPESPAALLKTHGSAAQQAENVKAMFFSHMHFDHVGDGARTGFLNAELWVGPTSCTYARPGYPVDQDAAVLSDDLPSDGSRKIVESLVPDAVLEKVGDKRAGLVSKGKAEGKYEAVDLREQDWIGLGAFDRGFDVFGDGSAYLIDAPGHSPGHQMMLIRVNTHAAGPGDDFVLLTGDCFHHPALLQEPLRMARPPYSKGGMHADPDMALETISRAREFALQPNVWVIGAHDHTVGESIAPGQKEARGLVLLNDWREKKWKTFSAQL